MRLIDANYLKTWFGEKDLYTYDYIIGTIDDAPTVKPEAKLFAEVKLSKEELQEFVNKTANKIRKEMEQPEQHWIPCSERLPDEAGQYLCTLVGIHDQGLPSECGFEPRNKRGIIPGWSICEADGFKFLRDEEVIAWMPLPELYKEEGDSSAVD